MNVHVTCLISPSHVTPVSFNPQEGQNVCWMNQTTCMWLMPFKSSFLSFTSPHGPFEFERWWKWVFFAFYITCMNFMGISWMRPFFVVLSFEEERGRQNLEKQKTKNILGWVCLKGLSASRDHDTVKIFCGRSLAGYSSIDVTRGKTLFSMVECDVFFSTCSFHCKQH